MTLETIAKLEEMEKKATPGKWSVSENDGSGLDVAVRSSTIAYDYVISTGIESDGGVAIYKDADLICYLRNNAPELLAMARWALENGYKTE